MSHIPKEGLKIVCISGYIDGKPIWRTVGSMRMSSTNKVIINLDKTFNPAGVSSDDGPTVMLNALPFSQEELQKKEQYRAGNNKQQRATTPSRFDHMDDDIPF